jgi:hypothetical protein
MRRSTDRETASALASQVKEGASWCSNPHFVVRVEKKPDLSFGEIMNAIRTWLDHRKIEPISFEPVAKAESGVGFEISFNTEDEAQLFQREFA